MAAAEPRRMVPAADVQSIIRRATQLEAEGRDMLGHDTVLDIARELNVDSTFVREALRRHRDSLEIPPLPALPGRQGGVGRGCAMVLILAGVAVGLVVTCLLFSRERPGNGRIMIRHGGDVIEVGP